MTLSFVETRWFTEHCLDYFIDDEGYRRFQTALSENPDAGRVMPGTGGFRKIRWADPRRGKGKRGGIRVIYLHVSDVFVIVLADAYDKDAADDLSAAEKSELERLAGILRDEMRKGEHESSS